MNRRRCADWVGALREAGYDAEMLRSSGSGWAVRVTDEDGESALLFDEGPQLGAGPLLHDAYALVKDIPGWPHADAGAGATLRARRHALGLSQAQLARALGVEPNTIAVWERGVRPIGTPRMLDLALRALETQTHRGGDEPPNGPHAAPAPADSRPTRATIPSPTAEASSGVA